MHRFLPLRAVRLMPAALSLLLFLCHPPALAEVPEEREGMPLVFSEDFESGHDTWAFTDADAWEIVEDDGDHALALHRASKYLPPVRSPRSIARIKNLEVTDFIFEATVKQTGREYGHRDLCFFFGYQDPSHFYYAHLASKADEHANSIFLVNGEPRVSIADERTDGTEWTEGYHRVRIKRDTESGQIEVYFDDMDTPVFVAKDTHFTHGSLGVGSFDDQGHFDDIHVWGRVKNPESAEKKAE